MLKLIRDKYINIIEEDRLVKIDPTGNTYRSFLIDKLYEEIDELSESDWKDVTEYADVYEVFLKLMEINGITEEQVIDAKKKKCQKFGAFDTGLILQNH